MWQSHLAYHPTIGYTYTPHFKGRLPHVSGGYLVRTNEAGFRADRPFKTEREAGSARAVVFGDSQTAGLGVGNQDRFTEILEKSIPGLEVFNYGLDGSGSDQQYLAYIDFGGVEHDLLIIALYVEDVERVNASYSKFIDEAGQDTYYAKPFFEIKRGELILRHVPVPKAPVKKDDLSSAQLGQPEHGWLGKARGAFRSIAPVWLKRLLKDIGVNAAARRLSIVRDVDRFSANDTAKWRLFATILKTWIERSPAPVLLLPIPSAACVEGAIDATRYRQRIRELAAGTGCHFHDPLPDLRNYPQRDRLALYFKHDGHLTRSGHRAIAESATPAVKRILSADQIRGRAVE